jgi:hypothetical protein
LGFRQLTVRLELTPEDCFVDCGSGTGRLVLLAAKECGVRRAVGVELSAARHTLALDLLAASTSSAAGKAKAQPAATHQQSKGRKRGPKRTDATTPQPSPAPALFVRGDCAAPHLWSGDGALAGATVVFTCSIMFDEALMSRIARRIEGCPTVRIVATLQRFPGGPPKGFVESAPAEMCETSWMAAKHACPLLSGAGPCTAGAVGVARTASGSAVYIYVRVATSSSSASRSAVGPGLDDAAGVALVRTASGASEWRFSGGMNS